jgi:putative hydrolase of the HAD superfamily
MKCILFDLDNTLYDTRNYYLGAFQKISNYLSTKYSINEGQIYDYLASLWKEKSSMYSHLFDDVLKAQNLGNENIPILLKIFNGYEIRKEDLYEDVVPTLKWLMKNYKIGVITDGTVSRQRRKIEILGIEKFFDTVIFTKNIEPKPSSKAYLEALNKINIAPEFAAYVGDNPLLDFRGAKEIGMKTIRIQRGEFAKIENNDDVDYTIKNLLELQNIMKKLDCE